MLTNREREAATALAAGRGRADLAAGMAVSLSTVDKLIRSLKTKLGATSQVDLAMRCRAQVETDAPVRARERVETSVIGHSLPERPADAAFAHARTLSALFDALHALLAPFGITHCAYSHVRARADGSIEHLNSRWSLPPDVTFDHTIPPEENLAFRHAMASWVPAPLDLEAMAASEIYAFVPEAIRQQNARFIEAGFARGVTFALPGLGHRDRLVLSALMRHASAGVLEGFMRNGVDPVRNVLTDFRNAHVALAVPRRRLRPRDEAVVRLLADGRTIDAIAEALGISRRATDRALARARDALDSPTNAGAVATFLRDRAEPALPF